MSHNFHRPPFLYSLMELRAPWEALSLIPSLPILKRAPKGDGQPVLVIPGFLTSDSGTYILRRYLKNQGYTTYGWKQGRNPGLQNQIFQRLIEKVEKIYEEHGNKVSLVGWSLGGVYSRIIAHELPDKVRQVITLGSPFGIHIDPLANDVAVNSAIIKLYERLNADLKTDPLVNGDPVWQTPPPVPSTAVYTERDGIAAWHTCVDDVKGNTENIKVAGSHTGLTHNPVVMYILAERLAQQDNAWQPFNKKWYHRALFAAAHNKPALVNA